MLLRVLGSAAGGGFPQWNCACANCTGMRQGLIAASPRRETSVGLSTGEGDWFLINASPDIRAQIESCAALHPYQTRSSPIHTIILTNGDLDHCLGLLMLRENHRLVLYATDSVRRGFTEGNVLYRTLQRFADQVTWRTLKLDVEEPLLHADGKPSGLTVTAVAVPGKLPIHLEGLVSSLEPDINVGLRFRQSTDGGVFAYFPAVGRITASVLNALEEADCVMFDGTFWSSDELSAPGYLEKSAEELAHCPVGGSEGSLATLSEVTARRRVFIHINNTNPMLRDDSYERHLVEAAGWEVAWDGMGILV